MSIDIDGKLDTLGKKMKKQLSKIELEIIKLRTAIKEDNRKSKKKRKKNT